MTYTIAIIGTSGSRNDMIQFNKENFDKLTRKIEKKIDFEEDIELWSGGSSGIDHIAVVLGLKYNCPVKLFLPAKFDGGRYYDNGEYSYYKNNGKQLNNLHQKFSKKIGTDTLKQITELLNRNGKTKVYDGFFKRNDEIAKADYLLAISNDPVDGGTKYTWDKCRSDKKSYDINSII